MSDRLVNSLNHGGPESQDSSVGVLQNLSQYDLLTSFPVSWHFVSMDIFNDTDDFRRLKAKINSFIEDYPTIVGEIKDFFYDELIEHILKRSFRVQFTSTDSAHTNTLFTRFFNEQDANIRIIFNYFFDDVKPLLLSNKFQGLAWPLRQAIIYTPKSILLQLTMTWFNLKGAESLTSMLYRNLINPPEDHNVNAIEQQPSILSFSFDRRNIWLFITIYIFLLFAINIHSIEIMINCLAGILLIAFILYYSLTNSNIFNR